METSKNEDEEFLVEFHGILLDKRFIKYWNDVETFLARPDDLVIASFPKSGKCPCYDKILYSHIELINLLLIISFNVMQTHISY